MTDQMKKYIEGLYDIDNSMAIPSINHLEAIHFAISLLERVDIEKIDKVIETYIYDDTHKVEIHGVATAIYNYLVGEEGK